MVYEPLYNALQMFWDIFTFLLSFFILRMFLIKIITKSPADKPYLLTQNFCNDLRIWNICNKYHRKVNQNCWWGVSSFFNFFLVDVGLHSMKQQMFMYVLYKAHLFQDSTFDLLLFLSKIWVVKLGIGLSARAAYPPVVTVFHSCLLDTKWL